MATEHDNSMEKIVSLCKRRGFVFPGSDIYGGLANSWDFGPLGAALKRNVKNHWWRFFVERRDDMVGLDAATIMNPRVWKASGHVDGFSDPLIECKHCHTRFREDKFPHDTSLDTFEEEWIDIRQLWHGDQGEKDKKLAAKARKVSEERGMVQCPVCLEFDGYSESRQFNLMLKTFLGPAEESANVAYLRPETAQAMFVDFPYIAQVTRRRLPFGVAQIGKAFRNEITPGNFIFRTREFEQMEIEYFFDPNRDEWGELFDHWKTQMEDWMKLVGIDAMRTHATEIPEGDRAHYSSRTIDFEFDYPFGRKELFGLAYRGDYDMMRHAEESGKDVTYRDPETNDRIVPHVIEPSLGVERGVLAILLSAYTEESVPTADGGTETRVVMKFAKPIAPVKVAILPLSKKPELQKVARGIFQSLAQSFACEYDETQSIGKRYRRQDEIGTPYCVTVDFDTIGQGDELSLKDTVTVRDRDTMQQDRVKVEDLQKYFEERLR